MLFVPEGINDDSMQDICALMAEGKRLIPYKSTIRRWCFWGLFTWRGKDPSTRKILEGETIFFLVYT